MILICCFLLLVQDNTAQLNQEIENWRSFGVDESGKLDDNMGNTYFQLGEYSHALVHYYRAYFLRPRDPDVLHHLNETIKKLGLDPNVEIPRWYLPLSSPERLKLFSLFFLLSFLLLSWYIWNPPLRNKALLKFFFIISLSFLVSAIYLYFFEKDQLVLREASNLFQKPATTVAKVKGAPLSKGSRLELLDVEPEGMWIKVKGQDGDIGYIESIKAERILK